MNFGGEFVTHILFLCACVAFRCVLIRGFVKKKHFASSGHDPVEKIVDFFQGKRANMTEPFSAKEWKEFRLQCWRTDRNLALFVCR